MVLVVAATTLELDFVDEAETLCCGIGPIEAALATAHRISVARPKAILHIGIAGATKLEPPALVLGSESIYCDVIDPTSKMSRVYRIEPDGTLFAAARAALPEAHVLPIGTTAKVGGGVACDVEAMEGFGVLRAAAIGGVPAVELRVISNEPGDTNRDRWRVDDALAALRDVVPKLIEALDVDF
jgi:nucleoside phosphorylase